MFIARALGACMLIYRFLTGEDDAAFCHKVTRALSEGWQLHGGPTYAFDGHSKKMKAGQAVTRAVQDQPYDPDKKLTDY
tara:strand:+ start:3269 stop:3505 length:237 start_codon:yes stop_codon:yes gene_type:complete